MSAMEGKRAISKWLVIYVATCVGAVVAVLFAAWALNGFAGLGIGLEGTVALVLGITFTVALGIGLMALVFQSDRSDHDAAVYRETAGEQPPDRENDSSRHADAP